MPPIRTITLGLILLLIGPLGMAGRSSAADDSRDGATPQGADAARSSTGAAVPLPVEVAVVRPPGSAGQDVVPASYQTPPSPANAGPDRTGEGPAAAAPRSPSADESPLPLPPRGRAKTADGPGQASRLDGLSSLLTIGSSLAVVLGLFFVAAWVMRRVAPRGSVLLPAEVLEVLGRAPLAGRQQVQLIRCGSKLLLVCVAPEGAKTLTEISDADEVTRLAGLCRQAHPQSTTAAFRQVFQHKADRLEEQDV